MDIVDDPPTDLLEAMRAAADRDLIARQYIEDFRLIFPEALSTLISDCTLGSSLTEAIVHTHVFLISRHGDSLIARKGGLELSDRAAKIAKQVYLAGNPVDEAYHEALADFDFWLRSDGNRRNPGTTADLVAAALFAGLRDGLLTPPWR
jgi:triphosphoribosyl-dephospho-CoA synthase